MKVYIGPYVTYFGPYQIAEKILFWKDKDDDAVENLGDRLAEWTWLTNFCFWLETKRKRRVKIRIDDYDVFNADYTLALIIVPVLKKLKERETSIFVVDDESCPASLTEPLDRWHWAIDEMIFSFESVVKQENYWIGYFDGDTEGRKRIENGFRLFGKHFEGLWE